MSIETFLLKHVVINVLTLYYGILTLLIIAVGYVKSLFVTSSYKLKLEPPACLSDPKYGTHKYLKVNNTILHYVESGDPSKPLMLFIHGFPEFWYSWRHQIVDFQKDYWCIAVDMRGYGDSERPEGVDSYKIEILCEDLRDLIRQLGREKCIIVAHDWGGLTTCRLRDLYPEVFSAVVLLATFSRESFVKEVIRNPEQRKKSWYVFMYRWPMLPEMLMRSDNLGVFDKFMLVPGNNNITSQDIECYKYWFGKQSAFTYPMNYYRANFNLDIPKKNPNGDVPMLLVLAENDKYIQLSVIELMKQEYPNLQSTILENCNHFLQQEEPVKVNKLIREFLKKNNV